MKRVILVISSVLALGFWSEVFAESFGCTRLYSSPNPMSSTSFAKTYGGTNWDEDYSVQQTSDGGYIVAGRTWSFGVDSGDIFLIKTDARGNIGSCSIVQDVSPIVDNAPFRVTSRSPSVSSPSPIVNSVSPTVTSPNTTVSPPCP